MENIITKPTEFAMQMLKQYLKKGDCAIDATVGNGNDTLTLCRLVGESGRVYGFDIQKAAIERTAARLQDNGIKNAVLFCASHGEMEKKIPDTRIQAVIFNLGYLPGGDHSVTTHYEETKKAIDASLKLLQKGGLLAIVFYPGHPAGAEEKEKLLPWLSTLPSDVFHCVHTEMLNQPKNAPSVLLVTKKKNLP